LNKLEKKSFYSFLALYLGSSLLFVLLSGFWYYSAQKNALENTTYYKLQHLADSISSSIISAHMTSSSLHLPKIQQGYEYLLISSTQEKTYKENYFEKNGYKVLVSSSPQEHLNIKYVVVKTNEFHKSLASLQTNVSLWMALIFLAIVFISWMLSKLFMRPIRQKVQEIEGFVQDISHELNTPITALGMSSKRAIQKGVYDEKILRNISISTKQLYTIYQSLTYLNFSDSKQESQKTNLEPILQRVIEYYSELSHAKNIRIDATLNEANLDIISSRVELLFSNLLSNAIKYSMPESKINIVLKEGSFSIEDEGVGIQKEKLDEIFVLYNRSSNLAGGFGVGLSIVKEICDEFKIKIKVESKLGEGSRFELSW